LCRRELTDADDTIDVFLVMIDFGSIGLGGARYLLLRSMLFYYLHLFSVLGFGFSFKCMCFLWVWVHGCEISLPAGYLKLYCFPLGYFMYTHIHTDIAIYS